MINNIRKLNVFSYQKYQHMSPNEWLRNTGRDSLRHPNITSSTIMKMMFREYPEDTEVLLGMGISLGVETYHDDSNLCSRWSIIAHVTTDQKRKWEEYKFMEKLSGKEKEVTF